MRKIDTSTMTIAAFVSSVKSFRINACSHYQEYSMGCLTAAMEIHSTISAGLFTVWPCDAFVDNWSVNQSTKKSKACTLARMFSRHFATSISEMKRGVNADTLASQYFTRLRIN